MSFSARADSWAPWVLGPHGRPGGALGLRLGIVFGPFGALGPRLEAFCGLAGPRLPSEKSAAAAKTSAAAAMLAVAAAAVAAEAAERTLLFV